MGAPGPPSRHREAPRRGPRILRTIGAGRPIVSQYPGDSSDFRTTRAADPGRTNQSWINIHGRMCFEWTTPPARPLTELRAVSKPGVSSPADCNYLLRRGRSPETGLSDPGNRAVAAQPRVTRALDRLCAVGRRRREPARRRSGRCKSASAQNQARSRHTGARRHQYMLDVVHLVHRGAAQLADPLGDTVHTVDVSLAELAAVGVDR